MSESVRQKKVSSLLKNELSRLLLENFQNTTGLITITKIEMTKDLQTAHVYFSVFDAQKRESALNLLNKRKGYLRRAIASRTKLKYNPLLVFHPDLSQDLERQIDILLKKIGKK